MQYLTQCPKLSKKEIEDGLLNKFRIKEDKWN